MNGRLKIQYLLASIARDLEALLDEPEFQHRPAFKRLAEMERTLRNEKRFFSAE